MKLIESIPDRKSHDKWDFCLRLASCYGLRPIECSHKYLEIRKTSKGQPYLYCTYIKKSGSGQSKPRRLWPLHDYWQKDWNLIERVKRKHELPPFTNGASDGFKDYLKSNDQWKESKEESPDDNQLVEFFNRLDRMRHSFNGQSFSLVEVWASQMRESIHNPTPRSEWGKTSPSRPFKWMLVDGLWTKNHNFV